MTETIIQVPQQPLKAVAALCSLKNPYQEADELFLMAMREIILWHADRSLFYQTLLRQQNFTIDQIQSVDDLARMPWVFSGMFKRHELLSIAREQVFLHLTSSGTSGQKSQMFFDEWTITSAQRMVEYIWNDCGWVTPEQKTNYLLYTYEPQPGMKLGTAFTDNYLTQFAAPNRVVYALRNTGGGGHEFDSFGVIDALCRFAEEGLPVRIFGFPAFMYFTLERMSAMGLAPLKLHPASMTFFGGGWKGQADRQIDKGDLYKMIHTMLAIPDERIRDGYGSVEHCVPYIECSNHQFHVPAWSKAWVRDVRSLALLPEGETGFLQLISPYITSAPAHNVITGDLAALYAGDRCGCGIKTPFFKLVGRAGTSQNRSCAIAAAEMIGQRGGV